MRLELAIKGLDAPLHPGAVRYYREKGLEIPPRLLIEPLIVEPLVLNPAIAEPISPTSDQATGV